MVWLLRRLAVVILSVFAALLLCGFLLLLSSVFHAMSMSFAEPAYGTAIDKAKDAALIQTGLQGYLDQARSYSEDEVRRLACKLAPKQVIDVLVVSGASVYRRRLEIPQFPSPVLPGAKHSATVAPAGVTLNTSVSF